MTLARLLSFLMVLVCALPALAVQPDEILPDKALEARARAISAELRCLVCQNQSIDDSDAPLARDLRLLIREQLTKGESDGEVMDFVVARYGEFVLLKPPLNARTILLWGAPFILLLLGAWLIFRNGRNSDGQIEAPLSEAEKEALRRASEESPPPA